LACIDSELRWQAEAHTEGIIFITVTPSLKRIIATASRTSVKIWNIENTAKLADYDIRSATLSSVQFTSSGHTLVVGSADGVNLYDTRTWNQLCRMPSILPKPSSLAFNAADSLLACRWADTDKIFLYDANAGTRLKVLTTDSMVRRICFSPSFLVLM
jgi:WD40 repeat protein